MKTFQLLVFMTVVGLALFHVLGPEDRRRDKNKVLIEKKNSGISEVSFGIQKTPIKSSQINSKNTNKDSSGFGSVPTYSEGFSNTSKSRLDIVSISWQSYFEEWKTMFMEAVRAVDNIKVSDTGICQIKISGYREESDLIELSNEISVASEQDALVFNTPSGQISFDLNTDHRRILVASTEILNFCAESARYVKHVSSP